MAYAPKTYVVALDNSEKDVVIPAALKTVRIGQGKLTIINYDAAINVTATVRRYFDTGGGSVVVWEKVVPVNHGASWQMPWGVVLFDVDAGISIQLSANANVTVEVDALGN